MQQEKENQDLQESEDLEQKLKEMQKERRSKLDKYFEEQFMKHVISMGYDVPK